MVKDSFYRRETQVNNMPFLEQMSAKSLKEQASKKKNDMHMVTLTKRLEIPTKKA